MISVLILTLDEQEALPDCLDSLAPCYDVVVLDSGSSDGTRELAVRRGCRVFERPFDDFAGQRNWALDNIEFRHQWIFHLDADEQFTTELRAQCEAAAAGGEHGAYLVPSKLIFMGRWLRHAAAYPVYQMRFHKLGEARFVQHGHGQREARLTRGLGRLSAPYLHFNFRRGLDHWLERHNLYSRQEAEAALRFERAAADDGWRRLVSSDPVERRRALIALRRRLPLRPGLKFVYLYLLRGGFLDGRPGLRYCALQALYEYLIVLKTAELRRRQRHAGNG